MTYYIMKRDSSYEAGATRIDMASTKAEADRKVRGLDGTINGKPAGRVYWLDSQDYESWYDANVAPLYSRRALDRRTESAH